MMVNLYSVEAKNPLQAKIFRWRFWILHSPLGINCVCSIWTRSSGTVKTIYNSFQIRSKESKKNPIIIILSPFFSTSGSIFGDKRGVKVDFLVSRGESSFFSWWWMGSRKWGKWRSWALSSLLCPRYNVWFGKSFGLQRHKDYWGRGRQSRGANRWEIEDVARQA